MTNNKPMEPDTEAQEEFFERSFEEVEDGFLDLRGFYNTPNGSFWDDDGCYFNRLGLDKHGGSYDKYGVYLPGKGWNEDLNCYEDDIDKNNLQEIVCTQVIDNVRDELVDESNKNNEDELNEEQMRRIYDEIVRMNSKKRQSMGYSKGKATPQKIIVVPKENSDQIMTD